ncbi:Transcriptional repressor MprA [Thalassocella blandensis]|nr:Transcriptional repressor MprA [Thalassocella blandensis]
MASKIETKLLMSIIDFQSRIQRKLGASLSAHGIGLTEYLVLNQLYMAANQKMRRSDLAELVGLSPSGITRLLNPMEKIGLVEKEGNPRDARVSLVALSKAGRKIFEESSISFEHTSAELFNALEKKQVNELSQLFRIIAK